MIVRPALVLLEENARRHLQIWSRTLKPRPPSEKGRAGARVWIVDSKQLEVGDVLVSTTAHTISRTIRAVTRGDASHAGIHIGGGYAVEAVGTGVHKIHVRCFTFPSRGDIKVLRPSLASPEQLKQASKIARGLVYRPYSVRNAVAAVLPYLHRSQDPGRFCSQVVAEAFAGTGFPLIARVPAATTPANLAVSQRLVDITDSVVRQVEASIWDGVVKALTPRSYSLDWPSDDRWRSPYRYEQEVYQFAIRRWARHETIRKPFHYFDLIRLLADAQKKHPREVKKIDEWLAPEMDAAREKWFVLPKGIADKLIDRPIMWDLDTRALSGPVRQEFIELMRDLSSGSEWNTDDWRETAREMLDVAAQTDLASVWIANTFVLRDAGWMEEEYRTLHYVYGGELR